MFGDLADACRSVLAHIQVGVPEALENVGEHLGLHHDLGQIHRVLRNLSKAAAYLLSRFRNEVCTVWENRAFVTLIEHSCENTLFLMYVPFFALNTGNYYF